MVRHRERAGADVGGAWFCYFCGERDYCRSCIFAVVQAVFEPVSVQPDVGRQTRQPWICSRFMKVVLTPNIGLEELQNRAWSEVSKTHNLQKRVQPAQAGEDDI